jgi:uncharacterized protein YjeT (DUF2065 family)
MESLIIFCAVLSIVLGIIQLLFPKLVDSAEQFLDQLFHIKEHSTISFRRVIGLILIIIGVVLLYSANKHQSIFNTLI